MNPGLVILDFYGTLARPVASASEAVTSPREALDNYLRRQSAEFDSAKLRLSMKTMTGLEHRVASRDAASYARWWKEQLLQVCEASGMDRLVALDAVDWLMRWESRPLELYPDAILGLESLRDEGVDLAICSNWAWDLDRRLAHLRITHFFQHTVSSAQAGYRKPHPRIYEMCLGSGYQASEAAFVGDSIRSDVEAPVALGMRAVHIWRQDERGSRPAPLLPRNAVRATGLCGLWEILTRV